MCERIIRVLSPCVCLVLFLTCIQALFGAAGDETLLARAKEVFDPLPKHMASEQNPITSEKVALGKTLFYETRISADGTVSCSKCHPMGLYAADGLPKPMGNNCKVNPRNAPTILNAAAQISAHWIGNRTGVEDQAKQAIIGPPSFGMASYEAAEKRLKSIPGYAPLFKKAFPNDRDPVTIDNFAKAVGTFERTLITPAAFDTYLQGNANALNQGQKRGLQGFIEVGRAVCHAGTYLGGPSSAPG